MAVIRSADYDETVTKLMADPIIRDMAKGLANEKLADLQHDETGTPRHGFMMPALDEYKRRGGKIESHIGGPAEALLRILNEERTVHVTLPAAFHDYLRGTPLCTTPPEDLPRAEAECRRHLDASERLTTPDGLQRRLTFLTEDLNGALDALAVLTAHAEALYKADTAGEAEQPRRERRRTASAVLGHITEACMKLATPR
ncbi:hypothetical protein [Actinomadura nitritigenes]|uniref:hypothetical protein n=1 Tax=Actinomadura nitritigenes TaxID=134602 RepID=UPI003D8CC9BE